MKGEKQESRKAAEGMDTTQNWTELNIPEGQVHSTH
jgi:hypothetical protein